MTTYIQTEGGTQPGKHWLGVIDTCNLCWEEIQTCFIDGQIIPGPATGFHTGWAIMCPSCFKQHGKGIGPGLGQKYCKQE